MFVVESDFEIKIPYQGETLVDMEHDLQLSNAHVWVPPGTRLRFLQRRKYMVEYSLDT
jgi:hypothetical protein